MQWLVGLLGLWYLLAPFIIKASSGAMWNGIIVGIVVAICAYMFPAEKSWQKWLGVILGLWALVTAFFWTTGSAYMWNNVIVGILIAIAGFAALGGSNK
ncbi:SPW repeat domain-containing protein [Coprothermobacter platensis]|jgi:hypothetical protein|uniref:SPW repeat domain-containing protein n=1 Tax=Coprothermobacter platensis TaxID=108819 RepID=UPI000376D7FF|nr:SPW repeat protein [Coprothermobacter platensis]